MSRLPKELQKLSEVERIQLAQDLWDSIAPESDALRLRNDETVELERRVAEHLLDPASAIPWDVAREELRARFGA